MANLFEVDRSGNAITIGKSDSIVTVPNSTASRLLSTDGSKALVSTDIDSWIGGTSNQVTVTNDGDGTVTLSTPQDIDTDASPSFANIILKGPKIDIRAYGAVDDGSTDCATAFTNALAALPTDGGVIFVPSTSNSFKINSTITLPAKKFIIEGGGDAEISTGITDGSNLFVCQNNTDVMFYGIKVTGNATCGHGLYSMDVGSDIYVSNSYFNSFTNSGKYAIYVDDVHKFVIDGKSVIAANANGIYCIGPNYGAVIRDNHVWLNAGIQAYLRSGTYKVDGNTFDEANGGSSDAVVKLDDFTGSVTGNKFDARNGYQHLMELTRTTQTDGCTGIIISGNGFEFASGATDTTKFCISVSGRFSGVSITANSFLCRNATQSPVEINNIDAGYAKLLSFLSNRWDTNTNPINLTGTLTGAMVQDRNGNIAIGGGNPSYRLHVTENGANVRGMYVDVTATGGSDYGVIGVAGGSAANTDCYGIYGNANNSGGLTNYGVYGAASAATTNWAGYFSDGNVYVANNLGIGITPQEDVHAADTVRADNCFNVNGTDGKSGAVTFNDGDTIAHVITLTGGICSSWTKGGVEQLS